MKLYKIKVTYTFTGTVEVRAESKAHAKEIVDTSFGMVAGEISSNNESDSKEDEGVTNWNFDAHPTTKTIL